MQQTHAMDNKHYGTQRRIDGQQWCYKTDPAENSTGRPSLDPTKPTPPLTLSKDHYIPLSIEGVPTFSMISC